MKAIDSGLYVLDQHGESVRLHDLASWALWMKTWKSYYTVRTSVRDCDISTVFLGIDHRVRPGPPVLWETMIFQPHGRYDQLQWRYASQAAALAHHWRIVTALVAGEVPPSAPEEEGHHG